MVIDLKNPRDNITDSDTCVKTKSAEKYINTDLNVVDLYYIILYYKKERN